VLPGPIAWGLSEGLTEKAGRKGREGKCGDITVWVGGGGWVKGRGGDQQLSVLLSQSV
jgi:hypothetical protein